MRPPVSVSPLSGKTIGSTDDGFVIAEWQDAGGATQTRRLIAPVHVHHKDDEAWYVLEGRLGVQVGDQDVEADAGAAVFVPRGTPHTYWNAGDSRLRYLLVMTPRIHRLIQAIHSSTDKSPSTLRELFRAHDSELLG
jgi:mannose-6-phosphate isomerase-like protein (cupin superfamily)